MHMLDIICGSDSGRVLALSTVFAYESSDYSNTDHV